MLRTAIIAFAALALSASAAFASIGGEGLAEHETFDMRPDLAIAAPLYDKPLGAVRFEAVEMAMEFPAVPPGMNVAIVPRMTGVPIRPTARESSTLKPRPDRLGSNMPFMMSRNDVAPERMFV